MSKVDITLQEKKGNIDGEYKFDLDMDVNALKTFISSKFNNYKPVRLSFEGRDLNDDYTLKDVNLVTGDTIEYEIINMGGKSRKNRRVKRKSIKVKKSKKARKSRKSRKSRKHRRTKRHH